MPVSKVSINSFFYYWEPRVDGGGGGPGSRARRLNRGRVSKRGPSALLRALLARSAKMARRMRFNVRLSRTRAAARGAGARGPRLGPACGIDGEQHNRRKAARPGPRGATRSADHLCCSTRHHYGPSPRDCSRLATQGRPGRPGRAAAEKSTPHRRCARLPRRAQIAVRSY